MKSSMVNFTLMMMLLLTMIMMMMMIRLVYITHKHTVGTCSDTADTRAKYALYLHTDIVRSSNAHTYVRATVGTCSDTADTHAYIHS